MEILRWIRWQWRQWEVWQKFFILSMVLLGMSVTATSPMDLYFALAGITIIFGFAFKWFVIDALKASYKKYKRQRDELFNTIKGE